jgi:hypothetical protein
MVAITESGAGKTLDIRTPPLTKISHAESHTTNEHSRIRAVLMSNPMLFRFTG